MLFYVPDINSRKISGEPLKHFISMRKDKGDIVKVTDFKGNKAKIELIFISKKSDLGEFKIIEKWEEENQLKNILIQSITDRNYQEKMIEIIPHAKIQKVIFYKTDRSSPQTPKLDRLEKILIRSCEQAELSHKPKIEISKKSLKELIEEFRPTILDFEEFRNGVACNPQNPNTILIGPEGGFSESEKKLFKDSQCQIKSLGSVVFPAWLAGFSYFQKIEENKD